MPSLQSLRGIAALGVVLYHVDAQIVSRGFDFLPVPGPRQGWIGVDLFFVLSAYLLGQPFLHGRSPKAQSFFVDRFLRIAPAYYVAFAFSALVMALLHNVDWDPRAAPASLVFLNNFRMDTLLAVNSTFWTIAVEMQFYLLLPLLVQPFRTRWWPLALAAMFAVAFGFRAWVYLTMSLETNVVSWFSLPGYLGHFGLGLAAARFVRIRQPYGSGLRRLLLAAGFAVILLALWAWYPYPSLTFEHTSFGAQVLIRPTLALGFAGVVIATASGGWVARALTWRPLAWIGAASYSIYLVHYPVLLLAARGLDNGLPVAVSVVAMVGGSLLAGAALYSVVEAPAERWRRARKHRVSSSD
ncbi:MAG: acyltransferase [Candidatus Thermoplasmatota archaeon]